MHPWAETIPWECLERNTGCISKTHDHSPMVGDKCGICRELFVAEQRVFAVSELPPVTHGDHTHPQWVCEDEIEKEPV